MKVGILITCYNRPEYLKECLWSLERVEVPKDTTILLIDDASTDHQVKQIIYDFKNPYATVIRGFSEVNSKISATLLAGYERLFNKYGCDIVINFDSDAIIRPDCITKLLELYQPNTLLTGFHSTTENRHKVISEHDGYVIKQSVGGINFCIDKDAYNNFVKPALLETTPHGNWDNVASVKAGGVMCAVPSLVQHIGFNSSLGHHDNPDVADDFYYWDLPNVTLLGVDSDSERLNKAKDICTKWIKYGDVVTLNPDIRSKEAYSKFLIKEAYKHITTSHVLIFQHDGYVHNWKAWDNDWLQYDYIGAPWWYNDGMDVGNGGFSLRSKRLMEIIATDPNITELHPEDHVICRTYRKYLENTYAIKFAPLEVAEMFSYEGYKQPDKKLDKQFGKHGNQQAVVKRVVKRERYVVNQYQGLGDVLFLVPLIRALIEEGNEVIWPIADHYFNIAKHFPDLDMRRKSEVDVLYNSRLITQTKYGKLLPYRFAQELMGKSLRECMQCKYSIYGHNWKMWRGLRYKRDKEAEAKLVKMLNLPDKFQLVNVYFGEAERGATITPKVNPDLPVVEMRTIDGFSLIDWLGVVELASELHTANTSIMYLLELMELNNPVYVYPRGTWGEKAFEHTEALWDNKDFIFQF